MAGNQDSTLVNIAKSSPGTAAAAAQKGVSKVDQSKVLAVIELRNKHNELTAMPQADAYRAYRALPKETQNALAGMFDPKYIKQDRGVVGGILDSIKSAVWYGGGTVIDIAKQVAGIGTGGPIGVATDIAAGAVKGVAGEVGKTKAGQTAAKGVQAVADVLTLPQEKLVKQPYRAARLETMAQGETAFSGDFLSAFSKYSSVGFKELLPGGEDAKPEDNSSNFMKYWEQASSPQTAYDNVKLEQINAELNDPAASYVGRLLASKGDFVDSYDEFKDNPGVVKLIADYVSGDKKAVQRVATSVAMHEKAKLSPGRDVARALFSLLPHEAEKAVMGDTEWQKFFNAVSGPIDFTVTFGADPLILAGKAKRSVDVFNYGLARLGAGKMTIESAFKLPKVQKYWDNVGKLIQQYRNGSLEERAVALNTLQSRYREVNVNVVQDLANADVRNAADALVYFDNEKRFIELMSGGLGYAGADTLIPRMTMNRSLSNAARNATNKLLGVDKYSNLPKSKAATQAEQIDDFAMQFTDDPNVWANKIGIEKTGVGFTSKDRSTLARIDRVTRQFEIAPALERNISISDASSSGQIFKLARTVLDKTSAGKFRVAWINGNEGQRLLMFQGLLKTLGYGMGLNLSAEGRLLLSKIDDMSREVYSVSQSVPDLGDLADTLKIMKTGGLSAPKGVRRLVQNAVSVTDAERKASRLLASTNARLVEYGERLKALRADKKDAIAAGNTERVNLINSEIKIVGARFGQERKIKAAITNRLEKYDTGAEGALDDIEALNLDRFNAGQTVDGTPRAIRLYQLTNYRTLPDFVEWRDAARRAGILGSFFGSATNNVAMRVGTDIWSFGNLYPRLGIRTTAEETGTHFLIGGTKGFANYLQGRIASRELRLAQEPGYKQTIVGTDKEVFGKKVLSGEKEVQPLGIIYNQIYKIMKKQYTPAELKQLSEDPVALGKAVAESMLRRRILGSSTKVKTLNELDEIKRLNPNMENTNGVALVKTSFIKKFLEFDRTGVDAFASGSSAKTISKITNDLKAGKGFTDALILEYWVKDGKLYLNLTEGNHRLQSALQAGVENVPVKMVRSSGGFNTNAKPVDIISKIQPDRTGYLPGNPNPRDLLPEDALKSLKQVSNGKTIGVINKDIAAWTGDWAEFNGKVILDSIVGSSVRAEQKLTVAEEVTDSLRQFGPSVALNVQNQKALQGMKFKGEFGEISYTNDSFLMNWFLELNNTVGKRNGQFGNIVLWNAGKKQDVVINKLVDYIEGPGNEIAKRFAIYAEEGPVGLATKIYADATYALRDYSGRINMELVNGIRNKGGMKEFTIDDLATFDKPRKRPESVLGREIVPLNGAKASEVIYRVINNGYGWVGKQIALLDREPITLGNYFMFRKEMKGYQANYKKSLMANGLSEEGADSISRFAAHEASANLAVNRTLGFVDNGDVRTNLAYSMRTLGRYYRATEDFYRRAGRLVKYEKRALVRLAILNQSFEDSGFIHRDDRGELYFTYPADDVLNASLGNVMKFLKLGVYSPLPVNFGGYVKMLTPSLDPESAFPRFSNPFMSVLLEGFTYLPYGIGSYLKNAERKVEPILTGTYNPNAPLWEKIAPANLKRTYNLFQGSPEINQSRFSTITKAMRLLVSTGNGPTDADQIDQFYYNLSIQARNVDAVKLAMGLMVPTSVQTFDNKNVPKEMINAGVFNWTTEYQKFLKRHDGDPKGMEKALVEFAKIYPSKLAYTVSATDSDLQANFRKTFEAAEFVKNNKQLMREHKQGAAFFIPTSGTNDIDSYMYLKSEGYVKNKDVERYFREVATVAAKQEYYAVKDKYEAAIAAQPMGSPYRSVLRKQKEDIQAGMFVAYPLLEEAVAPTRASLQLKKEALESLRTIIRDGKSPDKKLGQIFQAMILEYDKLKDTLDKVQGQTRAANAYRKDIKTNSRAVLVELSKTNANANALYTVLLDPLIGE